VQEQLESLIAHIAEKYEIVGRENLATEILVQILSSSEDGVVRTLFKHYGLDLPLSSDYQFHSQRKGEASRGIPDIKVKDNGGKTHAIIESKFDAAFTRHQPVSYLRGLISGGLLLFVVPERHQRARFEQLIDSCRKIWSDAHSVVVESGRTRATIDGKVLAVTSWDDALRILEDSLKRFPSNSHQRLCSDLDQLGRFCKVAKKEAFSPLSADQITGGEIPTLIHHLIWLTQKLITKCIQENIVQEDEHRGRFSKNKIEAGVDSSLTFGKNVQLCGLGIWIGFWARAWEDWPKKSPLWIEIDSKDSPQTRRIITQLQEERGKDFAFRHNFGWEGWLVPIPIKPVLQDEVVEEAFRFVSDLKTSIDQAKASL
jgi:hypothetical protein